MDIFSVITLFGGLAFFLYGMHLLSSSLEKMVGRETLRFALKTRKRDICLKKIRALRLFMMKTATAAII